MQPYFFPYLGHFALIANTDYWVVFDVTQYTPKSWMSRNRVLHPNQGWTYVTVPLANSSINIKTNQAQILDLRRVKQALLGKLSHYRRKAPFYEEVVSLVDRAFAKVSGGSLVELNVSALAEVCGYIGIEFNYQICSKMGLDFSGVTEAGLWAPTISSQLGAELYLNPIGGREIFRVSDFERVGVRLAYLDFSSFEYDAGDFEYEPNLSVLDVLMWNSADSVLAAIRRNSTVSFA